ncbi:hypothetical protein ABE10_01860, partial [Bacillus toyonensis]|nr:hypothetical protein [Bacillus toyonensis]
RQDDPEEDLPVTCAVHPCRLHDLPGDLGDEVVQHEDRQRHREDRVGDPHGREAVVHVAQTEPGEHLHLSDGETAREQRQQRDERHLDRHDLQREHEHEDHVLAPEVDPCEPVGRERRDHDRDDRGRDRDGQRVEEGLPERQRGPAGGERLEVVVQREARVDEDRPPARAVRVRAGPERGDEETEGRDRPEDRDDHGADRGALRREPLLGGLLVAAGVALDLSLRAVVGDDRRLRGGHQRISLCLRICRAL